MGSFVKNYFHSLTPILIPFLYHLMPFLYHQCLYFMFVFQVSRWESDVYKYLEEDESELSYSVRLLAFDLLLVSAQYCMGIKVHAL